MYAYLLARHFSGQFLLRIEDTDQERVVPGAVRYLIESLEWLGIEVDEGPSPAELKSIKEYWDGCPEYKGDFGPYVQSLRLDKYKLAAEELITKGFAYRCDCTSEMLEKERLEQMARKESPGYSGYCRTRNVSADTKHVVRFKMPYDASVTLEDAVRGRVHWEKPPLKDPVLLKSDGSATYHLASVVDDHAMQITHVMRGEEWLPTTPLHLMLYDCFGFERPIFCHLSQVLGPDGKKLSKRHGAEALTAYKEAGILPEALLNYVVLIGWSPGEGEEQEVFSREELIKRFSTTGLGSAGGVFDPNKLTWMNGVYIRNLKIEDFSKRALPLLAEKNLKIPENSWAMIAPHVQERLKSMSELVPMVDFLCLENIERDLPSMFKKEVDKTLAHKICGLAKDKLQSLPEFTIAAVEKSLRDLAEDLKLKVGPVFIVIRIAITGKTITPPLFESIVALGKDVSVKRLDETMGLLEK